MNKLPKKDFAPWLLLPGIVLTLSTVSVLAPHRAAEAAPAASPQTAPKAATYDDGDGDELLEHWGDPQYSLEARRQMAGMAGGFLLLGVLAVRRRACRAERCEIVPLPSQTDFLRLDSSPEYETRQYETRKAA